MNKKNLALTLVVFMLFSLLPIGAFADDIKAEAKAKTVVFAINQKNYKVGDNLVQTDAASYIKDLGNGGGRTMVPVVFVAPALGTEPPVWLPNDRMVMIKKGDARVYITIGSQDLLVNGKKMKMDVAAEILDLGNGGGRTMLPIAFIARALNVGYEWDDVNKSVYFYGYEKTYDQKGIFGPDSENETIEGSVVVKADGVVLQNMIIKGNLTIAEEVGDGDVTLNNITVKGETYIRGGGKDSIHINGGQFSNITIQNANGKVRIVAKDVNNLPVVIAEDTKGEEIILEGNFGSVKVEAEGAKITAQGQTTIKEVVVVESAKDSTITLNTGTVVEKVVLESKIEVKGTGTIKEADVNADGIIFEKAPEKQTVSPAVTTPPTTTQTPSTSSSGGGLSGSDQAKSMLNNKIAQKLAGNDGTYLDVELSNNNATITIIEPEDNISGISGTGGMAALFEITEIYALKIGSQAEIVMRDKNNGNCEMLNMKQVKDRIIADLEILALETLLDISGSSPSILVKAKVNGYDIQQTYNLVFE